MDSQLLWRREGPSQIISSLTVVIPPGCLMNLTRLMRVRVNSERIQIQTRFSLRTSKSNNRFPRPLPNGPLTPTKPRELLPGESRVEGDLLRRILELTVGNLIPKSCQYMDNWFMTMILMTSDQAPCGRSTVFQSGITRISMYL
jgi:hypothetical protein